MHCFYNSAVQWHKLLSDIWNVKDVASDCIYVTGRFIGLCEGRTGTYKGHGVCAQILQGLIVNRTHVSCKFSLGRILLIYRPSWRDGGGREKEEKILWHSSLKPSPISCKIFMCCTLGSSCPKLGVKKRLSVNNYYEELGLSVSRNNMHFSGWSHHIHLSACVIPLSQSFSAYAEILPSFLRFWTSSSSTHCHLPPKN